MTNQNRLISKEILESQLQQWARYRCLAHFYLNQTKNQWSHIGYEESINSMTRVILGLSPKVSISAVETRNALETIQKKCDSLEINKVPIHELEKLVTDGTLLLDGVEYKMSEVENVNALLREIGSEYILQWGMYGNEQEIILGRGTSSSDGKLRIYEILEEFWVSPNTMTAAAAVIIHDAILVRNLALETIFYLKWETGFRCKDSFGWSQDDNISVAIQNKVFELYEVKEINDLEAIKNQFISDLKTNVLHHEKGHAITQYEWLDLDTATFAEATTVFGESIISSLLEVFADLAMSESGLGGPLQTIAEIAKKDLFRAERMWWMYIADTWFFNTENEFMFPYSYMISALMFSAIQTDGKFNSDHVPVILAYRESLKGMLNEVIKKLKQIIMSIPEYQEWHEESQRNLKETKFDSEYQRNIQYWVLMFQKIKENLKYVSNINRVLLSEKDKIISELYVTLVPDFCLGQDYHQVLYKYATQRLVS